MDAGGPTRDPRNIGDLIGQLTTDLAALVRKEAELIRAEAHEKVKAAARAVMEIAAGGLLLMAALLVLLQALVLALANLIGPVWAALLVGVVVAAVGYGLVRAGRKALTPGGLKPDRSTRQLGKDAELIKGNHR